MRYINGLWVKIPKRKKALSGGRKRLTPFIVLFFLFIVLTEFCVRSVSEELTIETAKVFVVETVNEVLEETFQNEHKDYTYINRDELGQVVSVHADSKTLNLLKARLSSAIQKKLNCRSTVWTPVGSFTNIGLLNGRGFSVPLKLSFKGSAEISYESEFESAGINQSCHIVSMQIRVNVVSESRRYTANTVYETDIILSETVIVGTVPSLLAKTY
jgi:Sporulation protein YunB (Spo_YunB).